MGKFCGFGLTFLLLRHWSVMTLSPGCWPGRLSKHEPGRAGTRELRSPEGFFPGARVTGTSAGHQAQGYTTSTPRTAARTATGTTTGRATGCSA